MSQPKPATGQAPGTRQPNISNWFGKATLGTPETKNKGNQYDYERFLSSTSALWTVIDQQRLNALHGLHQRMQEYHNNIHVKDIADVSQLSTVENEENDLMVAHAIRFTADRADKATSILVSELNDYCQRVKNEFSDPERQGFVWIHLRDAIAINIVAKVFDIHGILVSGMHDLRAHSSFLPAFDEFLATFVICMRENNDFNMYKMYIYVSKHVIITFQAELLPDIMDPELSSPDKLVEPLFTNYLRLRSKCLKFGPAYLFYELALHTLRSMDSAMEFVSYSLSYFNKVVHLKLLHRERLNIVIKMHMISAAIHFFKSLITEANGNCLDMLNTVLQQGAVERRGYSKLLSSLLADKHISYLVDLSDSFSFVLSCLEQQTHKSSRLESEIDATMQLRTSNTSIVLSLIATIFLPLTFFAGVFGMNFVENGGYTIPLLNIGTGPQWFYAMCCASALFTIGFFISQGWLEGGPFGRVYKNLQCRTRIDDSRFGIHEEEALQRAKQEESRRKEEADARRSFSSSTKSFERIVNGRLSTGRGSAIRTTVQQARDSKGDEKAASPMHNPSTSRGSHGMNRIPEWSGSIDEIGSDSKI